MEVVGPNLVPSETLIPTVTLAARHHSVQELTPAADVVDLAANLHLPRWREASGKSGQGFFGRSQPSFRERGFRVD